MLKSVQPRHMLAYTNKYCVVEGTYWNFIAPNADRRHRQAIADIAGFLSWRVDHEHTYQASST